jgi:hypothetical protein
MLLASSGRVGGNLGQEALRDGRVGWAEEKGARATTPDRHSLAHVGLLETGEGCRCRIRNWRSITR